MGTYRNRRKFRVRNFLIMLFGLALLLSPFSFAVFADDGTGGEVNGGEVNGEGNGALDCEEPDGKIIVLDSDITIGDGISYVEDEYVHIINN